MHGLYGVCGLRVVEALFKGVNFFFETIFQLGKGSPAPAG
jgi:hypothetical protein